MRNYEEKKVNEKRLRKEISKDSQREKEGEGCWEEGGVEEIWGKKSDREENKKDSQRKRKNKVVYDKEKKGWLAAMISEKKGVDDEWERSREE